MIRVNSQKITISKAGPFLTLPLLCSLLLVEMMNIHEAKGD